MDTSRMETVKQFRMNCQARNAAGHANGLERGYSKGLGQRQGLQGALQFYGQDDTTLGDGYRRPLFFYGLPERLPRWAALTISCRRWRMSTMPNTPNINTVTNSVLVTAK